MKMPEATLEWITPEKALELLVNNNKNRALNQSLVTRIASDIMSEKWQVNGSTVRIDWDGNILDGQHRLHAIERAGKKVKTFIVYGLDPACMDTIDTNCRSRTPGDFLSMAGEKYGPQLGTALTWLCRHELDTLGCRDTYSITTIKEMLAKHPAVRDSVSMVISRKIKVMPPPAVAALHYLFSVKDEALAIGFVEGLANGFDTARYPAFALLYKRLVNNLAGKLKLPSNDLVMLAVKAWNATRKNRSLGVLRMDSGEAAPKVQ